MTETAVVLCPDLAVNCLGRAHVLARLLQPRFDVRVVGPCTAPEVWEPLRGDPDVPFATVPMPATAKGTRPGDGRRIWREVEGLAKADLVYVSKPFASQLACARRLRRQGSAILLDIDDTEVGILADSLRRMKPRDRLGYLGRHRRHHHREPWNVLLGALRARGVRDRSVSNRFLQERYGGLLVPHVRDPAGLDPSKVDADAARSALATPDDLVLFLGTPRPTKGLEVLVDAVARVPRARLAIVGMDDTAYCRALAADARRRLGNRLLLHGPVPFADVPRWMAAAAVVAIPQEDNPTSRGQLPAKVFDAMAMARPIVASAVSDLPEILEGCAHLVPPGDAAALAAAVDAALADPEAAQRMGQAARRRLVDQYSLQALRPAVQQLAVAALER